MEFLKVHLPIFVVLLITSSCNAPRVPAIQDVNIAPNDQLVEDASAEKELVNVIETMKVRWDPIKSRRKNRFTYSCLVVQACSSTSAIAGEV